MPRIIRTEVVDPKALAPDERAALTDALFVVHDEVFSSRGEPRVDTRSHACRPHFAPRARLDFACAAPGKSDPADDPHTDADTDTDAESDTDADVTSGEFVVSSVSDVEKDDYVYWDGASEVLAAETLTVPAGTCSTLHVRQDYRGNTNDNWIAPGVGLLAIESKELANLSP